MFDGTEGGFRSTASGCDDVPTRAAPSGTGTAYLEALSCRYSESHVEGGFVKRTVHDITGLPSIRSLRRLAIGSLIALMGVTAATVTASAAPAGSVTTFDLGPAGFGGSVITAGPDGNMWFTNNSSNAISVITPKGSVRSFPVPKDANQTMGSGLFSLTAGPDGNMWFTGFYANFVGKVTPAGVMTFYPVPLRDSHPLAISAGPDGNLWFTMDFANGIGRVTPDGTFTLFAIPSPGVTGIAVNSDCTMCPYQITAGPLESMWFTLPSVNLVGRITMDGAITTFPISTPTPPLSDTSVPTISYLTTGADGNLYVTQSADSQISQMTVNGAVTNLPLAAGSEPFVITPGPSDTLWFTEYTANALGRLVVAGAKTPATITPFTLPTPQAAPSGAATGPDGRVWYIANVPTSPNVYGLQVGAITTGYGPLLSATVAGTAKVGSRLTCTKTEANAWPAVTTSYRWLRNGRVIVGARSRTYAPTAKDQGAKVTCRVSVTYGVNLNQLGATAKARTIQE